jgi:hypothetical protein
VGADLGGADVADDRQRRVVQVVTVLVELAIGLVQALVLVLPLVLPGEAALLPDVYEAAFALAALAGGGDDLHGLLEGVFLAGGIGLRGRGDADEAAQVDEVLVAGGPFGQLHVPPLLDELLGCLRRRDLGHAGGTPWDQMRP